MASRAAAMGSGVVMGDLVLNRTELETGALVQPFPDLSCETRWGDFCLIGPASAWDTPEASAFRSWAYEAAAKDRKLVRC